MAFDYNREHTTQTTLGDIQNFNALVKYKYSPEEINYYDLQTAIDNHPLAHRPFAIRSKTAYAGIMRELKPTKKYLLPGQLVLFNYPQPKYSEELEYYDASPLTLFCGIMRTKQGVIREIGFNLHYFPPFARFKILQNVYNRFKPYWVKFFNDPSDKPNMIISYDAVKHIMRTNMHIRFGLKMYVPTLRGASYVIPTRLMPTAALTEGRFAKATINQVFKYWRQFR